MTRVRRLSLLACLSGLAASACIVRGHSHGDGSSSTSAKPDIAEAGGEAQVQAQRQGSADSGDVDGVPAIGDAGDEGDASAASMRERCPAAPKPTDYCSEAGALVGQWMMVDRLRVPEGAELLSELSEGGGGIGQNSLRIATADGVLYIHYVTCGACRRRLGKAFRGELAQMSGEQIKHMQAELGLREDTPVLDSVEAWRRYTVENQEALHEWLLVENGGPPDSRPAGR